MSSNNPTDEEPSQQRITHEDVATIPPVDEVHLVAWARQRRRLWLIAVPGLGLVVL